jgi:FlaA1/EpsC-like NDP-sugar epimerase
LDSLDACKSTTDSARQSKWLPWPVREWRRVKRQLLWLSTLPPMFALVYYLSYWVRFEGQLGREEWQTFSSMVLWVVLIKMGVFGWLRIHQGGGRYVTFYDLVSLIQAATVSTMVMVLVDRLFLPALNMPRSIILLDWGATIVLIGGARAVRRMVHERSCLLFLSRGKIPTFIVGANDAGESLLRAITRHGKLNYHVVGFIDDDSQRVGTRIGGVPVIGSINQIQRLAEKHEVSEVLIASGELSGRQVRKLMDDTRHRSINVRVLPSYKQLITGSVAIRPRPVSIDDLLRREPVHLDMENIRHWIDDRVLLVTGSAGSIGSEICRQLLRFSPRRIVLLDRSETGQFFLERELRSRPTNAEIEVCLADILDEKRVRTILQQHRPDVIFHAAAYKHVPLMESHPGEAVKNIVKATRQLADLSMVNQVGSFVMISTDKAVNPTSVMGACKRTAELYVQSLAELSACRFVTVRFGNVLDSAGSVVPVFRQQIDEGGPVTVTDPRMERFFMTIPEAARLVIQAGTIGKAGEILVLDMGEPVRIVDLAEDMIRLSGLAVGEDIEVQFIGLRPGEKLFEELHLPGEKRLATRHPKIMVADRKRRDPEALLAAVERLQQLAEDEDYDGIVNQLKQIVPQFHSGPPQQGTADRRVAA